MKNNAKKSTQVKESILPEKVIKQRKQRILEKEDMSFFFKKVFVVILAVGILLTTIYGIEFVEGQNMYPSIKDGDVAFYFRLNKEYQIGDVVAIEKKSIQLFR
ncbi:MAG: S24/S26 family peptidase [Clostridia bacterium]|nr:S24/S26 family peptidase [Clostridia bacterium]